MSLALTPRGRQMLVLPAALAPLLLLRAPFDVSSSAWTLFPLLLAVCAVLWLPGLALAAWLRGRWPDVLLPVAVPLGSALAGYAGFAAWFVSPLLGAVLCALVLTLSTVVLVLKPGATQGAAMGQRDGDGFVAPMALALLVGAMYLAVAGDHGGLARANHHLAHRYWVSIDSALPGMVADRLLQGREHLRGVITSEWLVSDRPPLQTGMMLLIYPLALPEHRPLMAFMTGLACNLLWIPGLWALLRVVGVDAQRVRFVVIGCALVGAVFLNSVYVWPKLLAAGLCLGACAWVLSGAAATRGGWAVIGALMALAFLAHGAIVYGLIALAPFLVWRSGLGAGRLLGCMAVAAALCVPWTLYQKVFDPPGDRLLKWHLAGQIPVVAEPFGEVVRKAYADRSPGEIAAFKWANVQVLACLGRERMVSPFPAWSDSLAGRVRQRSLAHVIWAPLLAGLGLIALLVRRATPAGVLRPVLALMGLSAVAFVAVQYGGHYEALTWLHLAPMSMVLLWVALGYLGVAWRPLLARLLIALVALYFWIDWVYLTGLQPAAQGYAMPPRLRTMTLLAGLLWLALLATAWVSVGRADRPGQDAGPRQGRVT